MWRGKEPLLRAYSLFAGHMMYEIELDISAELMLTA